MGNKIKTTRAYIQNTSDMVFAAGYCDLYYIFHDTQPAYYNCGVYGWNWDCYKEYQNGKVIAFTTGYRNTTGKWIASEILNKYTEKAKQIINNSRWNDYETTANELTENRKQFINELLSR